MLQAQARRGIPTALGVLTLISAGVLLAHDAVPRRFRTEPHDVLASLPLVLIVVAYVVHQAVRRTPPAEWVKTAIGSLAFLFWAANQVCPDRQLSTLFNDIAIALFVFDVFLVIVGWPAARTSAEQ